MALLHELYTHLSHFDCWQLALALRYLLKSCQSVSHKLAIGQIAHFLLPDNRSDQTLPRYLRERERERDGGKRNREQGAYLNMKQEWLTIWLYDDPHINLISIESRRPSVTSLSDAGKGTTSQHTRKVKWNGWRIPERGWAEANIYYSKSAQTYLVVEEEYERWLFIKHQCNLKRIDNLRKVLTRNEICIPSRFLWPIALECGHIPH